MWRSRMTTGVFSVWTEGDSNAQGCRSSLVSPNPSWAIRDSSPSHAHFWRPLELNCEVKQCRCAGGSDSWEWLRVCGGDGQAAGSLGHLPGLAVTLGCELGDPARLLVWPHQLPATLEEEQGLPQQWWVTGCRCWHPQLSTGREQRQGWKWNSAAEQTEGPQQGSWQVIHTGVPSSAWHDCRAALCQSWPGALAERRAGWASWCLWGPTSDKPARTQEYHSVTWLKKLVTCPVL